MQDMLQALDTLTNDELEAIIDRAEEILRERLSQVPLREDPAIEMWVDREDMKDSASMLPLLSSSCRHIFSPSCSGDGVPSSRAVWRLC